jgi:hypothetical protein
VRRRGDDEVGGAGAIPGVIGGATVGGEIGGWLLGLIGIKCLIEHIGKTVPEMAEQYSRAFAFAWHAGELDPRWTMKVGQQMQSATLGFARGHLLLAVAILSAIVLYLSRGALSKVKLYAELGQSKLGPQFAKWVEENEAKLIKHPALQPQKPVTAAMLEEMEREAPRASRSNAGRAERPPESKPPRGAEKPTETEHLPPNDVANGELADLAMLPPPDKGFMQRTVDAIIRGDANYVEKYWGDLNESEYQAVRDYMGRTEAGQKVLSAADERRLFLNFTETPPPNPNWIGETRGASSKIYLQQTEAGNYYELLERQVEGIEYTANIGLHEGLHGLGVGGSRRAEALVRLEEVRSMGVPIDRTAMRQVLTDMGNSYGHFRWRVGKTSDCFPGLSF